MAIGLIEEEQNKIIDLPDTTPVVVLFDPARDIPGLTKRGLINMGELYFKMLSDQELFELLGEKLRLPTPKAGSEARLVREMALREWNKLPIADLLHIVVKHPQSIVNELLRVSDKGIYIMREGVHITGACMFSEKAKGFSLDVSLPTMSLPFNRIKRLAAWLKFQKELFPVLKAQGYKYIFSESCLKDAKRLNELFGKRAERLDSVRLLHSIRHNGATHTYTQYRFTI